MHMLSVVLALSRTERGQGGVLHPLVAIKDLSRARRLAALPPQYACIAVACIAVACVAHAACQAAAASLSLLRPTAGLGLPSVRATHAASVSSRLCCSCCLSGCCCFPLTAASHCRTRAPKRASDPRCLEATRDARHDVRQRSTRDAWYATRDASRLDRDAR